jgi:AcrR family transcriptional regulator
MKNPQPTSRPRGRPRGFNRDEALADAMETFWRRGYEGASIADLTEAMGITPQSLYAAFGSKAALYREALAEYRRRMGAANVRALTEEPSAVTALDRVLRQTAYEFSRPSHPSGCMISTAALAVASENEPIADHLRDLRAGSLAAFKKRIEQAVASGEFKPETDPEALARFLGAIIQGMAVQARDGADAAALLGIADLASATVARHRADETARGGRA